MATLTTEPSQITAGDTVAWTKVAPAGYLASDGWTLSYALSIPGSTASPISITASADGDNYSVSITAATTAAYEPGNYVWHSYVSKSGERYQIEDGELQILPDPSAALGETHATRTLALIEAAIEGRVPRGLESYSIQGQQLVKITISRLLELRQVYADMVRIEAANARLAAGLSNPFNRFARFTKAR